MRLAGQLKGGYYPTPPRVVDYIRTLLAPYPVWGRANRGNVMRLLDPCCGPGDALRQLADSMGRGAPVETYGVELHSERAQQAAEQLDHVLSSDLFRCSIANRTFNLLVAQPALRPRPGGQAGRARVPDHCTRYLEPGGVLVYIVPSAQIARSARFLTTSYGEVQAWAFPEPESELFDQVVVLGERKEHPSPDARAMNALLGASTISRRCAPTCGPSTTCATRRPARRCSRPG